MTAGASRAREIAKEAHAGQVKRTGEPMIDHVCRVAASVSGEDAVTVAWLHDVAENAPEWTIDRLRSEGFAPAVLAAVDALTRRGGESYEKLVMRAGANPLAKAVKLADLRDNLAVTERTGGDGEKYRIGLRLLEE